MLTIILLTFAKRENQFVQASSPSAPELDKFQLADILLKLQELFVYSVLLVIFVSELIVHAYN